MVELSDPLGPQSPEALRRAKGRRTNLSGLDEGIGSWPETSQRASHRRQGGSTPPQLHTDHEQPFSFDVVFSTSLRPRPSASNLSCWSSPTPPSLRPPPFGVHCARTERAKMAAFQRTTESQKCAERCVRPKTWQASASISAGSTSFSMIDRIYQDECPLRCSRDRQVVLLTSSQIESSPKNNLFLRSSVGQIGFPTVPKDGME